MASRGLSMVGRDQGRGRGLAVLAAGRGLRAAERGWPPVHAGMAAKLDSVADPDQ
jgi:hypothetical protein